MDAITGAFLVIGGFSILLMLLSLLGGHFHLGHLHLGHLHLGHLHLGSGHLGHPQLAHSSTASSSDTGLGLTLPAIAGFLGMFGFSGAVVATLMGGSTLATAVAATAVGLCVGVPSAWASGRLVNAAVNMRTDATPTSDDLLGALGVVLTPVPAQGYGEVRLAIAGQTMKFNARADQPLARGTAIFVIGVPSPTSVLVEPTPEALRASPERERP